MENNFNKYFQIYNELKALNTEKKSLSRYFSKAKDAAESSTCGRKHVGAKTIKKRTSQKKEIIQRQRQKQKNLSYTIRMTQKNRLMYI